MLSGGFNMAVQQGPLPLTEADRIFDLFDTDHDGQLLPEEFQLASRVMRGELPLEIALVWNNQQAMKKHINQMQSELKEMKEMLTNLVAAPHARPQKPKLAKTVRTFEARGWPVQEEANLKSPKSTPPVQSLQSTQCTPDSNFSNSLSSYGMTGQTHEDRKRDEGPIYIVEASEDDWCQLM
ncbi:unnamed protein product [Durusdinium trenchii]|uniref:EF-hand domain-containing protein n=1 Tax=Durusdinium trenchii TaxID=1381693 RepID=A0ABP0T2J6_9DINO